MKRVSQSFFLREDVVKIARELLGMYLFTNIDGQIAGGIITETEAYKGTTDRACHAFGGRKTKRNEVMYFEGGVTYVYLCYGMHSLLNFVTNIKDIPDAVLIRGIYPTHGEELMLKRCKKTRVDANMANGPGKVTKLLGVTTELNNISLESDIIWVEDRELQISSDFITATSRIGVDYAGEDAHLPYRFILDTSKLAL